MRVVALNNEQLIHFAATLPIRSEALGFEDSVTVVEIINELLDRRGAMVRGEPRKILLAQLAAPIAAHVGSTMRVGPSESPDALRKLIVDSAVEAAEAILARVGL